MSESTVASADIARLAGVGRAAVSNWRRRFPDFPQPVGGSAASPLYRLADVEQWLVDHGRAAEISPLDRLWQELRSASDDHRLGDVVGDLAAALALLASDPAQLAVLTRSENPVRAADEALGEAFPRALSSDTEQTVVQAVVAVAEQIGPAPTLHALVARLQEVASRRLQTTSPAVCRVAIELADVKGRTVFDPACGTGGLLIAAEGARSRNGVDLDPAAARITAGLLQVDGADGRVLVADSLRRDPHAGQRFGAVLCEPPFAERDWGYEELAADPRWELGVPPRGEPELAWLQHCLAHADLGAPVVLVLPPATAVRRAGRRIRANLVRSGALRMIATLPDEGGRPLDLWYLVRSTAADPPDDVLFLTVPLGDIVERWRSFSDGPGARRVRPLDLLDEDVDLSPARHVPTEAGTAADLGALAAAVSAARAALPDLPALVTLAHEHATTTVGDLAKAGAMEIHSAPLRTLDEGPERMLTVRDLVAHRDPTGHTEPTDGMVVLREGDVVLPAVAGRETSARVVAGSWIGAVMGPRLLCLRPDPAKIDPHLLAGCLGVAGPRVRTGTGLSRSDARRLVLPLLPMAEQRALGSAFEQVAAFDDAVRRLATAGADYVQAASTELASGRARLP
ncbi:MAG: SAM-dependent methyltransferase [Pseudonocardiaceae bacterium]|nr:MAG: SAM-dependent methyltransferase [Pseudonocardiaceae bacterium]